jgi:cytidylate kinase
LPGSGKTTTARNLSERLGFKYWSMGDMRGEIAKRRGIDIDQLNEIGKREAWTDREVDDFQTELGRTQDGFIMEAWIGYHFIPHSVKIFLEVDPRVGAERVYKDQRPDEAHQDSVQAVQTMLAKRLTESRDRYRKYYGISDFTDRSHFDFVLDTTYLTKDQVLERIIEYLQTRE